MTKYVVTRQAYKTECSIAWTLRYINFHCKEANTPKLEYNAGSLFLASEMFLSCLINPHFVWITFKLWIKWLFTENLQNKGLIPPSNFGNNRLQLSYYSCYLPFERSMKSSHSTDSSEIWGANNRCFFSPQIIMGYCHV